MLFHWFFYSHLQEFLLCNFSSFLFKFTWFFLLKSRLVDTWWLGLYGNDIFNMHLWLRRWWWNSMEWKESSGRLRWINQWATLALQWGIIASLELVEIYRAIEVAHIDYSLPEDKLLWKHNQFGKFTISSTYVVQINGTPIPWAGITWFWGRILHLSFIT